MDLVTCKLNSVDLREIADFTSVNRASMVQMSQDITAEDILQWLEVNGYTRDHIAVLAYADKRLLGWLLLWMTEDRVGEINPAILGGHPVVYSGLNWMSIGAKLLECVTHWAPQHRIIKMILSTEMSESDSVNRQFESWYRIQGFIPILRYVEMRCELSEHSVKGVSIPEGLNLGKLKDVDIADLYSCYYEAFIEGDAQFFTNQTEEERRVYFDRLGLEQAQEEPASSVLLHSERVVGFTYVLPYSENNYHISCMCVHPSYQGVGLGKYMLQIAMMKTYRQGAQTMTLGTEREMLAYRLYRNHGFKPSGGNIVYMWQAAS